MSTRTKFVWIISVGHPSGNYRPARVTMREARQLTSQIFHDYPSCATACERINKSTKP